MRKNLSFLLMLMLCSVIAFGQSQNLSGKVTDQSGDVVPYATITVKGTKIAIVANADGSFNIKANTGDILIITAVGIQTTEVRVGTDAYITPTVTRTSSNLAEVTVTTAFGIKKDQRITPYSAQVIKADALNIIPQTDLNDALAGKFAGVQVRSQSAAKLGSESFQRIRGGLFLSGDDGPIYVVDGTIIANGIDINPNDVATVNVLKGANATALFGARARNGAIVITTKTAPEGKSETVVSQGLTFDKVSILPSLQNQFGGGGVDHLTTFTYVDGMPDSWKALDGKAYPDYTDDASWGPRMEGQEYIPWYAWVPGTKYSGKTASFTPQPDNIRDFWRTGVTSNTDVAFSKGGKGYNLTVDYTRQSIKGLIPNTQSNRNVLFTKLSADVNKIVTVGADVTYNTQIIDGEFNDGYANQSSGNFGQWNHRDLDMGIMKEMSTVLTPIGTLASWNWASNPNGYDANNPKGFFSGNYWYNFYSYFNTIDDEQTRNRLYGDAYIKVNIGTKFNLRGTVRKDQFNYLLENKIPSILERSGSQIGLLASYNTQQITQNEYNYELLASYNDAFINNDLTMSLVAGGNISKYYRQELQAFTNQGLIIPDLFALPNSKAAPTINNARFRRTINSVFGTGDFEYKKFISATFALREDWLSTQPASDANLFYPSGGLSFIPSELLKSSLPSWLTFIKLYGSYGKKPLTLDIFQANPDVYNVGQFQWNGNYTVTTPNTLVDSNFRGVTVSSYELGIDLRFIKNRIGLTINYYKEKAFDQPVQIGIGSTGGFTAARINAASVERNGLEFVVNGTAIATKNFNWNITANLAWLIHNPVTKIIEGQDRIQPTGWASTTGFTTRYASGYQILGKDWGQLVGGGQMKDSATGLPLIDPTTGFYVTGDPTYDWGSIVPKVTGGIQSLMTYKDFTLGASLDYQFGGKFFSLTESWGMYSGLLDYTAETNDRGKNVRDPVSEGGGVHVVGVSSIDGKKIDTYVDGYSYFHQFYSDKVASPFIHDLTYIKLREISLGYNVPVARWSFTQTWIKGLNISVVARNPWVIYRKTKNFDPSEISNIYGEDGELPPVRSIGFNLRFTF